MALLPRRFAPRNDLAMTFQTTKKKPQRLLWGFFNSVIDCDYKRL